MGHILTFVEFVGEAVVTVKRKYTSEHPAKTVSDNAPVREKILAFMKEKKEVTRTELMEFISLMNEETGGNTSRKWLNKNTAYFCVAEKNGEKTYTLSKLGNRVSEKLAITK